MSSYDMIIKNGTVATPGAIETMDIAVKDGGIAGLGSFDTGSAAEIFDASGLHVLPGVIDTQVHFREPGAEHKEDIKHGTMAAAMGGVTAIFEMPNTTPLTLTPETHADKIARAAADGWVDFAFFVGGSAENVGKLHDYETLPGCPGIKILWGRRPAPCWRRMTKRWRRFWPTDAAASPSTPRMSTGWKSASISPGKKAPPGPHDLA